MTEEIRSDQIPVAEAAGTDAPQNTQTRRQLLKVLAGTGVAAGMLALPSKWTKPVVEVGVLPVHAQGSEPDVPPYTFLRCDVTWFFVEEGTGVDSAAAYPWETLAMVALITPGDAGIQLQRTVTLNQPGHPQNGLVDTWTGPTDAGGNCKSADFDLATLEPPPLIADVGRLTVTWSFVNPAEGTGVCSRPVEPVA